MIQIVACAHRLHKRSAGAARPISADTIRGIEAVLDEEVLPVGRLAHRNFVGVISSMGRVCTLRLTSKGGCTPCIGARFQVSLKYSLMKAVGSVGSQLSITRGQRRGIASCCHAKSAEQAHTFRKTRER